MADKPASDSQVENPQAEGVPTETPTPAGQGSNFTPRVVVVGDTPYRITSEEELQVVLNEGAKAIASRNAAKGADKTDDKKVPNTLEERLAAVQKQLEEDRAERKREREEAAQAQKDQAILNKIVTSVKNSGVPTDFQEELSDAIIGGFALTRGTGNLDEIIKKKTESLKTKLAKIAPDTKIDMKKIEDAKKEVGKSAASSGAAGDDTPKKFGREIFNNRNASKSFIKDSLDYIKSQAKKALGD